jgi:hypothetical protein
MLLQSLGGRAGEGENPINRSTKFSEMISLRFLDPSSLNFYEFQIRLAPKGLFLKCVKDQRNNNSIIVNSNYSVLSMCQDSAKHTVNAAFATLTVTLGHVLHFITSVLQRGSKE